MSKTMIDNKIYNDAWFFNLSKEAKWLFMFLLTNESCNLIGCYELPLPIIASYTGLSGKEISQALEELKEKIIYKDGWVIIKNYEKHNPMRNPSIENAKERQVNTLPEEIKTLYQGEVDVLITDTPYIHPVESVSEGVNTLQGTITETEKETETEIRGVVRGDGVKITSQKKKYTSMFDLGEEEFEEIAEKYQVPVSFVRNCYENLVNYCESKGKRYKNYLAALRNFVKQDALKVRKEDYAEKRNKSTIGVARI